MSLPRATAVGASDAPVAHVTLDYAGRLLRRKRLVRSDGADFLVDLPHTTHVEPGQAFLLESGDAVEVRAADETLLRIKGALPRLAWHIGNRHTPCEVHDDHLLIQSDPVLREMLTQLGAEITEVSGPFRPEGGAYGHGRTMGHAHDH
ncbi:MAG: urease accessory protein UreE [Pseudomonadota bacterium]